jgi:hypothetical protein
MSKRDIFILLTDTGTWFSRMIKLYTKAPYNHASISLDENLKELYSFGRKVYYNPLSAGFIKEGVDHGVFFYKKNTKCMIFKLTVCETQFDRLTKNIAHVNSFKKQYRYNLLGIMAIAVNKRLVRKNAFTCSQFVASMLVMSGIHQFEKYIELVTPEDIMKIARLEMVFEGKLREYYLSKNNIYTQPQLFDYNQYNANV